jgi:hypothetical protein
MKSYVDIIESANKMTLRTKQMEVDRRLTISCCNMATASEIESAAVSAITQPAAVSDSDGTDRPAAFVFPVDELPLIVKEALERKVNLCYLQQRFARGLSVEKLCREVVKKNSHLLKHE